jgi:uncharacterized protein (DUF2141 family)
MQNVNGQNHSIVIVVSGLQNSDGKVIVSLYNSEVGFPKALDKAYKRLSFDIMEDKCIVQFENIPEGVYAVSCFHDENNNYKMDTNFIGIPLEGTASSNDAEGVLGPPKFKDAKFTVNGNVEQKITMEY